jgi:hypothetical protein
LINRVYDITNASFTCNFDQLSLRSSTKFQIDVREQHIRVESMTHDFDENNRRQYAIELFMCLASKSIRRTMEQNLLQ